MLTSMVDLPLSRDVLWKSVIDQCAKICFGSDV